MGQGAPDSHLGRVPGFPGQLALDVRPYSLYKAGPAALQAMPDA